MTIEEDLAYRDGLASGLTNALGATVELLVRNLPATMREDGLRSWLTFAARRVDGVRREMPLTKHHRRGVNAAHETVENIAIELRARLDDLDGPAKTRR